MTADEVKDEAPAEEKAPAKKKKAAAPKKPKLKVPKGKAAPKPEDEPKAPADKKAEDDAVDGLMDWDAGEEPKAEDKAPKKPKAPKKDKPKKKSEAPKEVKPEEKPEAPKEDKPEEKPEAPKEVKPEEKPPAPGDDVPSITDGEEEEKAGDEEIEDLSVKAPAPKSVRKRTAVRRRVQADKTTDKPIEINYKEDPDTHVMRKVVVEKVVVNIGVGEAGEKLEKAEKVLGLVTRRKPARTLSRTTNRDLGIRKQMPLGCRVTLRGTDADEFLRDAFWIKQSKIAGYSFDKEGNFSFGVPDYTDFPNQKYDPDIGIYGMDICVVLSRPGKRIRHRKRMTRGLPPRQRLSREEAQAFLARRFGVEVVEI